MKSIKIHRLQTGLGAGRANCEDMENTLLT
jgi:hypothetical protein